MNHRISIVALLGCLLAAWCTAAFPATADEGSRVRPTANFTPGAAELSAVSLLASAQLALQELPELHSPSERQLRCSTVIAALTGLYQLHGCQWVLPVLRDVYAHPDCPRMHLGYSADGRLSLRIEPLELFNPAYAGYTVYLCTLESNTSLDLIGDEPSPMAIELRDGTRVDAQPVTPDHPLWVHLSRLAHTFAAPDALPSGAGIAFKQLFAVRGLPAMDVQAVSLEWGAYTVRVSYLEQVPVPGSVQGGE